MNEEYPIAALEYMQRQHLNGRIFNSVEFGNYMEWNAPELKSFVDGREDIFVHNGIFDDYLLRRGDQAALRGPGQVPNRLCLLGADMAFGISS